MLYTFQGSKGLYLGVNDDRKDVGTTGNAFTLPIIFLALIYYDPWHRFLLSFLSVRISLFHVQCLHVFLQLLYVIYFTTNLFGENICSQGFFLAHCQFCCSLKWWFTFRFSAPCWFYVIAFALLNGSTKKVLDSVKKCVLRISLVHSTVSFKVVDIERCVLITLACWSFYGYY